MSRFFLFGILSGLAALLPGTVAFAANVTLNPSADVFMYEFNFMAPGPALPLKAFYPNHLAAAETASPQDGHDVKSLLKFDVASTGLTPGQVASATLRLRSVPQSSIGGPPLPFADPDASNVVGVNVFQAAASPTWLETTAVWSSVPATIGSAIDTQSVDGVNKYVTFDVTSLVVNWLTTPANNNGMFLMSTGPLVHTPSGAFVAALFDTTDANAATRPLLTITTAEAESVPEPSALALAGVAALSLLGCVAWHRRRRRIGISQ